jgi:hypothetical protein
MTGTIVIQPIIMFLVQAGARLSGWTGWSEFYRSF